MTVCGYHPKMADGLRLFAKGLVLAVTEKAQSHNKPLADQLAKEVDEVRNLGDFTRAGMADATRSPQERAALQMLHAIVMLAEAQFGDLHSPIETPAMFPDHVGANADMMCRILKAFEDAYEGSSDALPMLYRAPIAWRTTFETIT